ncbi:Uma2 family endonuclease [Limnospira fusiformis]|uniref:Uma2 family endonuclease n=1 Tax=Limnospira fusiformis TaxID=54297 RepID=UPI0014491594|nr:Uma2 family endonuclease [Limnospira fusiformis SAG 85.79]
MNYTPSGSQTILPTLENGDRLSMIEFERRYSLLPDIKKAELVEGVVYMTSPVRVRQHGKPHSDVMGWLVFYRSFTPNIMVCDNTSVRLDMDNEPQPDALLRIEEAGGGQSRISEDDYIEGPPELIVEIAASSASKDLHDKLHAYRRNGVREYLVWLVDESEFRWYVLCEGRYQLQQIDNSGCLKSTFFPGLWLDVNALLSGNMAQVLAKLQEGIATPEYQEFVQRLSINP